MNTNSGGQYLLASLDDNAHCDELFTWNEVETEHKKLDDLQKLYLPQHTPRDRTAKHAAGLTKMEHCIKIK